MSAYWYASPMDEAQTDAAIAFLTRVTMNLSRGYLWLAFAMLHLLAAVTALAALWWTQTTPQEVADWLSRSWQSKPVQLATGAGLSLLGVVAAYRKGARKLIEWLHLRVAWRFWTKGTGA